jgi:hypothetical protein
MEDDGLTHPVSVGAGMLRRYTRPVPLPPLTRRQGEAKLFGFEVINFRSFFSKHSFCVAPWEGRVCGPCE